MMLMGKDNDKLTSPTINQSPGDLVIIEEDPPYSPTRYLFVFINFFFVSFIFARRERKYIIIFYLVKTACNLHYQIMSNVVLPPAHKQRM